MIFSVLTLAALLSSSQPSMTRDDDVIWADDQHEMAAFVPETQFAANGSSALANLHLPEESVRQLQDKIARAKSTQRAALAVECDEGVVGDTIAGGGSDSSSLRALLDASDVSFVGTVTRVIPGWDARAHRAASLASIRVAEILKDSEQRVHVGDTWRRIDETGSLTIAGTRICSTDHNIYTPTPGARVLVYGFYDRAGQPNFVFAGLALPIVNDMVVPTSGFIGDASRPVALHELRAIQRGGARQP